MFLESGESETTLLWAVRAYFEKLLSIVSDRSGPIEQVVEKNLRAAQFALKKPLARQASFWKPSTILSVLNKLSQLEQRTRTTGLPKETVLAQAFLSLSQFAKSSAVLR